MIVYVSFRVIGKLHCYGRFLGHYDLFSFFETGRCSHIWIEQGKYLISFVGLNDDVLFYQCFPGNLGQADGYASTESILAPFYGLGGNLVFLEDDFTGRL